MIAPNSRITPRALALLRRELQTVGVGRGETLALVYTSRYVDRNGDSLEGFHPGYAVSPLRADEIGGWPIVRLADDTALPFFPMFRSEPGMHFAIDVAAEAFALFSIEPTTTRLT